MLIAALRAGLAAVRAGRRGAFVLALLSFLPLGLYAIPVISQLAAVSLVLRTIVLFGLIRLLAAHRPEPLPPLPEIDDEGRRIGRPASPTGPVSDADRRVRTALRAGVALVRPALRVTLLELLVIVSATLALVALSGGKARDLDPRHAVALVALLAGVGYTFIALTAQRIAIEGDPRVLVAAAHAVRIARTAYGPLLLLSLAQPAVAVAAMFAIEDPAGSVGAAALTVALFATSVVIEVVVTAVANELYLAGPRLDVPADFGARP